MKKDKKTSDKNGRELFYGVIAIATFIVMAIGATFAYFVASSGSDEASVKTKSASLSFDFISYSEGWMKTKLIPVDTSVAEYAVEFQDDSTPNAICMDDNENEVCSLYVFQVRNGSNQSQNVTINLVSETNSFTNLNAMIYEVSKDEDYNSSNSKGDPKFELSQDDDPNTIPIVDGSGKKLFNGVDEVVLDPIYVNRDGVKKDLLMYTKSDPGVERVSSIDIPVKAVTAENLENVADRTVKLADEVNIPGTADLEGSENLKTFMIVLYIKNLDQDQNSSDASKEFSGSVTVGNGDKSTMISGTIGLAADAEGNLQSKQH